MRVVLDPRGLFVWLLAIFAATASSVLATSNAPPLTAKDIIIRTVSRARSAERGQDYREYGYTRRAITEELDSRGRVQTRKEKLLRFQGGIGTVAEMKVNGRPVSESEVRKLEEKQAADRKELTQSRSGNRDDRWESLLSPDLLNKYVFTLRGHETVQGRPCYILDFKPASGDLPVKQLTDRVANALCGTIWVDAAEYEIAKARLRLKSEVDLWGGLLADLRKFDYHVERIRLPDGTWFNKQSRGEFVGRKLLDNFHVRICTESSDFRKIAKSAQVRPR